MREKRGEGEEEKGGYRSGMKKDNGNGGMYKSIDDEIKRKKNKGGKEGSSM